MTVVQVRRSASTLLEAFLVVAIVATALLGVARAAAVGLGGQAVVLLEAWGRIGVLSHPEVAPYVVTDAQVSFLPLVAGITIAVGAEVFRTSKGPCEGSSRRRAPD